MKCFEFALKICLFLLYFSSIFLKVSKAEYNFHDDIDSSPHSQFVNYNSNRKSNNLQCAISCRDGSKCSNQNCRGCEWNCGGKCNDSSQESCGLTCNQKSCNRNVCKGCFMCLDSLQSNGKSCPVATFKDRTSVKFSSAPYYWKVWTRSGRPYLHDGAPVFVDLNGDGVMDFFASKHGHKYELGMSTKPHGGAIDPISQRIIVTDTKVNSDFFVDSVVSGATSTPDLVMIKLS